MGYSGHIIRTVLCISIIFIFQFSIFNSASAQKYACVNTDYVLGKLPDYENAQKRLDRYVSEWQQELAEKAAELDNLRAEYEQEMYLLPENLKKRRQNDIQAKEQEIRSLQQQRFGEGGDLDKKRAELLKPIQDRVYSTIERVAQEKNYAFIFDKSGSNAVLFASKKYDISDDVLQLLGYKPSSAPVPEAQKDEKASKGNKKRGVENPELMRRPEKGPSPSVSRDSSPLKSMKKDK